MSGVDALTDRFRVLCRQTSTSVLADGACALLLGLSLWSSASPLAVGSWLVATGTIAVARIGVARRRARVSVGVSADAGSGNGVDVNANANDPARRWGLSFGAGSALSGSAWGAAAWLCSQATLPAIRLLCGVLIGGLCSLATSLFSTYPPAVVGYVVPALGGLALSLLLEHDPPQVGVAGAVVVYGIGLLALSRRLGRVPPAFTAARAADPAHAALLELSRALERRLAEREEALRKQAEALRDAQRLEAIGRLAGGVAHDFNNLLTILLADISELISDAGLDARARTTLREMRDASTKGAALVRQLLTFSRRTRDTPETLDLNRTLSSMDRLLRRLLDEGVTLQLELQVQALFVHMDPTEMEQVILNLITNARDAMTGGGAIRVRTDTIELGELDRASGPRRYARLSVSDTGVGMDAETLRHIFEPFFTTKAVGKGTGLGLSTAQRIVQQAGGDIAVSSEPRRGSCFNVHLPLAEAPRELHPESTKARSISGFRQIVRAPRQITILLVEDEPTVRAVTRRILESAGHAVLTSPSAERALEMASEHAGLIELLITDVVMAEMDGPALSLRLRAARAELRTLFISGYGREQVMPSEQPEGTAFLAKPFTHDALLDRVLELVAEPASRPRAAVPDEP